MGIVRILTRSDAELTIPIEAADQLAGNDSKISFIELILQEIDIALPIAAAFLD